MEILIRNLREIKKIFPIVENLIFKKGIRIFLLVGELGAGKTTFVKKLAKDFKIKDNITSPTFILWQKYEFRFKNKKYYLNHLDLYRLKKIRDILKIHFKTEVDKKENVFFIEWGEKLENYLKRKKINYKKIIFIKINQKERLLTIK